MIEITHKLDRETGNYVQVVSPKRLREILDEQGEDYTRPSEFTEEDEWEVES